METTKSLRVRPVLVETTEKSRICHLSPKGIEYNDLRILEIECSKILDNINYDIHLISLDDIAKDGDYYYDEHNLLILKANLNSDHKIYLYKKVIANQRQFSQELLEKLVEEYNNSGMKDFEIEMERMYLRAGKNKDLDSFQPTLTEHGYIIPVIERLYQSKT